MMLNYIFMKINLFSCMVQLFLVNHFLLASLDEKNINRRVFFRDLGPSGEHLSLKY